MDAVVGVPLQPGHLLQVGVQLHLVRERGVGRVGEQLVELGWGEVRDADVADVAGGEEALHGVPGLEDS